MKKNNSKFKKKFVVQLITAIIFLFSFILIIQRPIPKASATTIDFPEYNTPGFIDDGCEALAAEQGIHGSTVCHINDANTPLTTEQKEQFLEEIKGQQQKNLASTEFEMPESCDGWFDFACELAVVLEWLINFLIEMAFKIANFLFTYVVGLNNSSFGAPGTQGILIAGSVGWRVTRDVANMFFVFFLLWIAIATIFGWEQYGIKQLLPKLIVAALLINFSLPIAQLVINTSNALANVFIQSMGAGNLATPFQNLGINPGAATKKIGTLTNPAAATGGTDAKTAAEQLVNNTTVNLVTENGTVITYNTGECDAKPGLLGSSSWQKWLYGDLCKATAGVQIAYDFGASQLSNEANGWTLTMAILRRVAVKIIVAPIALFVIFAAVFMLIARLIALTFIVILGPLAFLLMILPQTQRYYSQWWDALIKWSFFFPAFMFFFWLGINILNAVAAGKSGSGPDMLVSLFVGIGFLIGSLIVSQQLGVAVAGTAMNMGKRWTTGMRRAAGRAGLRGGARVAGTAAKPIMETKAMQWLAAKPILRQMTKPFEAATRAKEGVDAERAKALQQSMKTSPAGYAAARFKGERAKVQEAYLKSAGEQDIQKLEKGLGKEGMVKVGLRMVAINPGLEKRISSAVKSDEVKAAIDKKVDINSPDFGRAYTEFMNEQTVGQLREIATADNIKGSERLQKYLIENGGEKEIDALTKNGEQLMALREVFQQWTEKAYNDPASQAGQGMRDMVSYLESRGATRPEAEEETRQQMRRGDFLEPVLKERGANEKVQKWAANAPMVRVVIGEGRIQGRRGEDFEDLLKRLQSSGGTGGTPPTGGTTP